MKIIKLLQTRKAIYTLNQQDIDFRLSYKIAKFISDTDKDEKFYTEKLSKIFEKYGTQKDGQIEVLKDKIDECNKEMTDLGDVECTPPELSFTMEELDGVKISPANTAVLLQYIKD